MLKLTLGTTPATLANQEAAAQNLGVHLAGLRIHDRLLGLNDGTGLALVIYSDDLVAQLELPSGTRWGQRLQDCNLALAIHAMAVIQVGNTWNFDGLLARVEISHLLVSELEGWSINEKSALSRGAYPGTLHTENQGVGRENSKVRVQLLIECKM